MLFSVLFWYTIVTASGGFIAGALLPMWGPYPAYGRVGLGLMGAALGPIAVPIFLGACVRSGAERVLGE